MPYFWAEAPPPFVAAVVFRVGRSDETLRTSGLSHLVEHLALAARDVPGLEWNGSVAPIETEFWASGSRGRVLAFLSETAAALGGLPLERLETERKILRAEAASVGVDAVGGCSALRFGPAGHGLIGYDEYGLNWLGERELSEWAETRFTRQACAVWMTGAPADDLEIELVEGTRIAPPEPRQLADLSLPSLYSDGPSGGVAYSFLGGRSHALAIGVAVAARRLRQRLRYELGTTYEPDIAYIPLTRDTAHVVVVADCVDERAATVRTALVRVLDELAEHGPTDEERTLDLELVRGGADDVRGIAGWVASAASNELVGYPFETTEESTRKREDASSRDVADALAAALETALAVTPPAGGDRSSRFASYPTRPTTGVTGRTHRLRGLNLRREPRSMRLVAGREGLALVTREGVATRVRFADCAAALRWPDGSRALWSDDGFYVEVSPADWRDGRTIVRLIDAHVPSDLVVPMEPELAARIAAVDEAVRDGVKRGWLNAEELDALPRVLEEGEQVASVAEANRGLRRGILAVTDRRLLFLYFDDVAVELPRSQIRSAREEKGSLLASHRLVVTNGESGELVFSEIEPEERLGALVAVLTHARAGEPSTPGDRAP